MRLKILITTIASVMLAFSGTASALSLDANVLGIFTDNSFATPVAGATIEPGGDNAVYGDLSSGQGILIGIDIENAEGINVDAIFASMIVNNDQVTFLGGSAQAAILEGGTVINPTALNRVANPALKGNSPSLVNPPSTEEWVQAVAYAAQGGTTGTGPVVNAVQLFFEVNNASGAEFIDFDLTMTDGDAINGDVLGDISGQTILNGATINVPEPGTALLMGLGLIGLAGAGRRR